MALKKLILQMPPRIILAGLGDKISNSSPLPLSITKCSLLHIWERGGIWTKSCRIVGHLQFICGLLPTKLLDNLVTNQSVFIFFTIIMYSF